MEYQKTDFLILECKPEGSDHPQGDRVLECYEFSRNSLKIKGTPRFQRFKAILSMPQDGSKLETEVEVIHSKSGSFEAKFVNPPSSVIDKISWWFNKEIDFLNSSSKSDQNSDISV